MPGLNYAEYAASVSGPGVQAINSSSATSGSVKRMAYVDNAYNRRLGRVGKPLGSHPVSKQSAPSSSSATSSSVNGTGSKTYVDNAYNRKLGRVGKPLGSHPVSKQSAPCSSSTTSSCVNGTGSKTYVDNAYNRSLGRVGKPLGSHPVSKQSAPCSSSTTSSCVNGTGSKTYVDNAYNRKLGRVGKPLGSHPVSKQLAPCSSSTTSSCVNGTGSKTYVDNAYNRKLGRVGKPLGSHPVSKQSGSCSSSATSSCVNEASSKTYVHNTYHCKVGCVGKPLCNHPASGKCYVDTPHNRRLKRAGKHIPPRYLKKRELMEQCTAQGIISPLGVLAIQDPDHEVKQSAYDRLRLERVEERWKDKNIIQDMSALTQSSTQKIPHNELDDLQGVGCGAFGTVYACLWKNRPVAYKKFTHQQMSRRAQQDFVKEIEILVTLDHPNTVKMFGAVLEAGNLGIVMELMKRTLFQALFNDMEEFEEPKKNKIISQLSSALKYLHTHTREIAHCDIKCQNVLLDRDNNAKICDFGLSVIKNIAETSRSTAAPKPARGTPRYSAPEVLRGEFLSKQELLKADIYSLSIVVFEVVAEKESFYGINLKQLEAQVGRGKMRPTSDVAFSESLMELLQASWDSSAINRPTASEFTEKWSKIPNLITETP